MIEPGRAYRRKKAFMRFNSIGKDHLGAIICVLLGVGVLALGRTYGVGTLHNMGSGFIPVVIGTLLISVGIAIGVTAEPRSGKTRSVDMPHGKTTGSPEWRGWICIIGGLVTFIVLGIWGGLVPASFFAVFIAALGDRNNTIKSSALLAAIVTVFGVVLFYYLLSLQLPLFRWG
jgi:hypothetical protein